MKNSWTKDLYRALENGNAEMFSKVPQVDLHCHSITSAPFEAFRKLSSSLPEPPQRFADFESFDTYLKQNINPLVKTKENIRLLLRSAFQRLINEGIVYTEMSFDLTVPAFIGISMEAYTDMIAEEKRTVANRLKVCAEAGLNREVQPKKTLGLLKAALDSGIFGSIDLYGYEKSASVKSFVEIYRLAGRHGLKLKAHVGETGSAADIREAVEMLNLDAVQHGIMAANDLATARFLVKRGTVLNICPFSNISLGLFKDLSSHPIRRLFDEGLIITIASDDFSLFRRSVRSELIELHRAGIFSKKEIERLIVSGLKQISVCR